MVGPVSVQHNAGPIDPAECVGHRRPFPAGRIGFAGKQIRPDGDALWYNSARSNPEPAKWGSDQGSRTPRQQIRADGQTVRWPGKRATALETGSARNLERRKAEP